MKASQLRDLISEDTRRGSLAAWKHYLHHVLSEPARLALQLRERDKCSDAYIAQQLNMTTDQVNEMCETATRRVRAEVGDFTQE